MLGIPILSCFIAFGMDTNFDHFGDSHNQHRSEPQVNQSYVFAPGHRQSI